MKIELLDGCLPEQATKGDAGYDIHAAEDIVIPVAGFKLVRCGFKMQLDEGLEAQIRSRSGLALKNQIVVLNSPGTIDPGYRGEIKVILANFGSDPFIVEKGDRIAQMVFSKFEQPTFVKGPVKNDSERSEGGFGSTGVKE